MPQPPCISRRAAPGLLAAALAVAACGGQDAAPQGPGAVPVTVVTLRTEPVTLARTLPGRASPYLVAEVRPQVTGIVQKRLFDEGSRVTAGQALYQIDDATYRAAHASARAAVARAEAALEAARLKARRAEQLIGEKLISQQDYDTATAALLQAEADLAAAEATLQGASVTLERTRIAAPIGGRIGKSAVTQGALVTANQDEPLATIQQLDPIYVDVTQSSAELLELRRAIAAGQMESGRDLPVAIYLEDGSRLAHDGRLEFADVTVQPTTGSFLLRVVVPNPDHVLLPGMYVNAEVGSGVRPDALLVPQQGVSRGPKGETWAMVVDAEGKAERRAVHVGRSVGDKWLVEDGLAAGDRVVVEGLQKIRPGVPVQPAEAGEPAAAATATAAGQ
jgi:membrane fusion protein (multidrug efflux system)